MPNKPSKTAMDAAEIAHPLRVHPHASVTARESLLREGFAHGFDAGRKAGIAMTLMPFPSGEITESAADGHYVNFPNRSFAQIISVGGELSIDEYEALLPRYKFVSKGIMKSSPETKGRFIDVVMKYHPVRAAALLISEIDQMDRAEARRL